MKRDDKTLLFFALGIFMPVVLGAYILHKSKNTKINTNFKLKPMNTKYLFQALRFACLPTLSVLALLFFAFFDIARTLAFISSDNWFAILLRILLVIAEVALVVIMYKDYEKKGIIEDVKKGKRSDDAQNVNGENDLYTIERNWSYNDSFKMYRTENENIIVIERTPKSN